MKVLLAKRTGFCFGVKRAIDMAKDALSKNKKVYSLGSIIHNKQVVDELSEMGLKVIKSIKGIEEGVVVISSHGISPRTVAKIKSSGLGLIDTTCPFVSNAQRIARSLSDSGYDVIIVGERRHPEVRALVDFVSRKAFVVKDKKEAKALRLKRDSKVSIIAQTTQSTENFLDVVKAISTKKPEELKVVNTICRDVEERQEAARELTDKVDAMFVIGGKASANTRRLFEICSRISKRTRLLETERGLGKVSLKSLRVIGITSGASTPDWMVKRVVGKIIRLRQ